MADNLPDVYLRFLDDNEYPSIAGESFDAAFPAKEGWLAIKSFNFGFGWGGSDAKGKDDALKDFAKGKKLSPSRTDDVVSHLKGQADGKKSGNKGGKGKEKEGTLVPKILNVTRNPGVASIDILAALRDGRKQRCPGTGDWKPRALAHAALLGRPQAIARRT